MAKQWTNYQAQPIRVKLIRQLAEAASPDKPKEILDSAAGLILRHERSGALSFYVQLGRGKRVRPWAKRCDARRVIDSNSRLTLGMVKEEALRLRAKHVDGEDIAAQRRASRAMPTLTEYLDDTYEPWALARRRSGGATVARLRACFETKFGKKKLTDITPAEVGTWSTRRHKNGIKAETINRDLAALRGALGKAMKLKIIEKNPLAGIEELEVDRHKQVVRALTAPEKAQLIEAFENRDAAKRQQRANANKCLIERGKKPRPNIGRFADVLTPAVIISLETGVRRGELFSLEWPSIDLNQKMLCVKGKTAKNYETREIPLNKAAYETLRDWWLQCGQPKTGYVFSIDGGRLGDLKKSYYPILTAAGIKRVNAKGQRITWHSLRHTFGSLLGAAKVDPTTLMKLMGHANMATTQQYLHTDEDRKREAVERLSAEV